MFRIFDRYLLKNFLVPFSYSLFGLVAIWLVYDLGEHANEIQEAHLSFSSVAEFYLTQIPFIVVTWMPLCVLLGLLYVLTRMSRRNEIVSMLSAGVSISRILTPLIVFGLFLTGACTWLNYDLAPRGEWAATYLLEELARGKSRNSRLEGNVFPNRTDHRIWFMQLLNRKTEELQNVVVIQQDASQIILFRLYGQNASYDATRGVWTFYHGKISYVDPKGNVIRDEFFESREFAGWSETPWRLGSSVLKGKFMTVPQLEQYLQTNSDFPTTNLAEYRTQMAYRFALPWNVLVVILVASPLSIVFTRRGALGGVAGGLLLFVGLFSTSNVFMALGQGARVPPMVAAWTPAGVFMLLGLFFLYLRATNRPIPFLG